MTYGGALPFRRLRGVGGVLARYGLALLCLATGALVYVIPGVAETPGTLVLIWVLLILGSAGLGGFGPGLLTTALGVLACTGTNQSSGHVLRDALFAVVGITISGLVGSLQRLRRRANIPAETFSAILRASVDHIYVLDRQGRYLYVSEGAARVLGRKPEEMIRRTWRELGLSPEVMVPFDALRESVLLWNEPRTGESDFDGAMGPQRFEFNVAPIEGHGPGLNGVVVVSREITERKQAQEANARLAAIVESSDDAIIGMDVHGRITSWNRGAETIFGYSAEEMIGGPIDRLIPADRKDEEKSILGKICRGEQVVHFESVRCTKDGRAIDVSLTTSPIRDGTDRIIGASKVARDISARKHAEAEMRRGYALQEQFAKVAASVPGVICSYLVSPDSSRRISYASPAIEGLFGFSREVLAESSSHMEKRIHHEDYTHFFECVQESTRSLSPFHSSFRYRHLWKGERCIEIWSQPTRESDGGTQWHGFVTDVTEFRNLEAAKRESERLALSVLDSLAANIAVLEEDGKILTVNRAWREIGEKNGVRDGFAEGANYFAVCDSAGGTSSAGRFTAGIRAVLEGRQNAFAMEYCCQSPTELRWFIGNVHPFLGDGPRRVVVSHWDVTDRKMTEEQLRDGRRFLAQSQAMAHVGSWELDLGDLLNLDMNPLRWSDECYRIFGYEPGAVEVTNALFFGAVHPDDRAAIRRAVSQSLAEHAPYELEHRITCLDGQERVVREWGELVVDLEGKPIRLVGTCQDITAQKRAEQKLRESEERFHLFMANSPTAAWIVDESGTICYVSPTYYRMFDVQTRAMEGKRIADVFPPEVTESYSRNNRQVFENGETLETIEKALRPDGSEAQFLVYRFLLSSGGSDRLLAGVAIDITERVRAEQALQAERDFSAGIIDGSPAIICGVAVDGTTRFLNREGEAITGYTSAEIVGKNWWRTFYPGDEYRQVERFLQQDNFRKLRDHEMTLTTQSGEKRTISWNSVTRHDRAANVDVIMALGIDVTERQTAERALDQSRAQLWAVVENLELGIVVAQSDGRILHWNHAALAIHGYADVAECRAEIAEYVDLFELSTLRGEVLSPDDWPMARVLRGERLRDLELCIRSIPNGWTRIMSYGGMVIRDPDDQLLAFLSIHDITERKAAEKALRESEDRLSLATQSANLGTWDVDMINGKIVWSARQEELFGLEPGTFRGSFESSLAQIHPDDLGRVLEADESARETGQFTNCEHRVIQPDGGIRWVAGFGRYFHNEAGVPVRMVGISQDITERKRAEEELSQYAQRLEIFHDIDQAILGASSPGEIARVGLTHLAPLVSYWAASVIAVEFEMAEINIIASVGASADVLPVGIRVPLNAVISSDLELLRRDGVIVVEDVQDQPSPFPMHDELMKRGLQSYIRLPLLDRGELIGALNLGANRPGAFTSEDITIVKEVADQMAIALRQAMLFEEVKAANSRLESLSRRLIHAEEEERRRISRELHDQAGQNLTALTLQLQGASRRLGEGEPTRLALDESIEIAGQTLKQIRDISLALRPSHLDDLGLVAAIRSLLDGQARAAGFKASFLPVAKNLDFRLDTDLETACFRVVQEALTNCVRYAAANKVCVELYHEEDELSIVVKDDGIGFDVDTALARAEYGASLGLIGMRERVKLLGGLIIIRSKAGGGTEVSASFPITSIGANRERCTRIGTAERAVL
ncbi:MAG: PAS domain S-box protein [Isosphaeraceae bacterium]|nr:PAS domain S-box protein [Isosphaeraceae bacterium]